MTYKAIKTGQRTASTLKQGRLWKIKEINVLVC